jgi:hypothetical protein
MQVIDAAIESAESRHRVSIVDVYTVRAAAPPPRGLLEGYGLTDRMMPIPCFSTWRMTEAAVPAARCCANHAGVGRGRCLATSRISRFSRCPFLRVAPHLIVVEAQVPLQVARYGT